MVKQKVLLAINNLKLENYIIKKLDAEFEFVKPVSYRAGILSSVSNNKPDIVVITEDLTGKEPITKIVYEIFKKYNDIRIIFVSNERLPGDKLLNVLINYKVYDLIIGDEVQANEIIHHIRIPSNYNDIAHLHAVEVVDEEKGETLFEVPDYERPKERIIEVVKKVYVDTSPKQEYQTNNELNNDYQDDYKQELVYEPFQTSLEDLELVIGVNEFGQNVKVKDVLPNNYYYYNNYFFSQINEELYYFYHEGYFFDKNQIAYVNYKGDLISYEEFLKTEEDEFVIETKNDEDELLNEQRNKEEEMKNEKKRLENERLEREKVENERLERERKALLVKERIEREKKEEEHKKYMAQMEKERIAQERLAAEERMKEEAFRKQQEEERRKMQAFQAQEEMRRTNSQPQPEPEPEPQMQQPYPMNPQSEEQRNKSFMNMFGGKTQHQMIQAVSSSNKKFFTFVGSRGGAGTTTIAFNTAVALANQKSRVLYIEYNYKAPSTTILYDVAYTQKGIDTALKGLEKSDLTAIEDAIVHFSELKRRKIPGNPFKLFSDNLSMMTFSKEFIINYHKRKNEFNESFTRELFLYFLFQSEYDYIILDMQLEHISNETMYQALFLSQKICLVTLPDISYIGYATYHINEWANKSILLNNRLEIIVNRFEKTKLSQKILKDWLETDNLFIFPDVTKSAIEVNYDSVPLYLKGNNDFKEMINTLLKQIK